MRMKAPIQTKYTFTTVGFITYYLVLAATLALVVGRGSDGFLAQVPFIAEHGIAGHLSNFALTTLYLFATGAIHMLVGVSWPYLLANAALLLVLNIVVELFVTVLNVPDMTDALYGIAGVAVSLGLLVFMHRFGIRLAPVRKK
ncbi:MAG TPA: hypothetical protein VD735_04885 [Candidatus Saccharimonadales bacterium]|nr:hypothetical protein [Candidatus Saccharimonadales bacterium]